MTLSEEFDQNTSLAEIMSLNDSRSDPYPDFILNDGYRQAYSHIVLASDNQAELIPDFLLEPINQNSFCDLLELKLPSASVFILKKNRMHFSAAVCEARAQLLEYSRFFDERDHRDAIERRYGLRAYKLKMLLIIGRIGSEGQFDRRKIEATQPDLCLNTYDDLVERAKFRLRRMKRGGLNIPT